MDVDPLGIIVDAIERLLVGFFARLPEVGIALVVLALTLFAARGVRALIAGFMQRAHVRDALVTLATNMVGIASWILGVAIAIIIVFPSVTPAQFIAGLGLTSVAIGFAFKDVFENFLAGVIILGREKMRIGDVIQCEGVYGRIENILIRETHVRETDGELVIVPNAFLFQNPLKIQTDLPVIRQELVVGVDYDSDLESVRAVLENALTKSASVDSSKETEVRCIAFGASSIDFKLLWWSDSQPRAQRASFNEVAFAVKAALDESKITIPFPQATLSWRDGARRE
jgi:small conductance mechanosensitive channel